MRSAALGSTAVVLISLLQALPAFAQPADSNTHRAELRPVIGYARFVDDAPIEHLVAGVMARFPVTPRMSVGPDVLYMRGPGTERNWVVEGSVEFDLVRMDARQPAVPYLVAGGGLFHHRTEFFGRTFSSTEGAVSGGGGVKIRATDRVVISPEVRLGWELHWRFVVGVGYRFGR